MKKVVFMCFPDQGHMNPSIELCRQLGKKGVKVVYYALEKDFFRFEGIENIEMRSYPEKFQEIMDDFGAKADKLVRNLIKAMHMLYYCNCEILDFIVEEMKREKPDLIINDIFAMWGKMAGRYLKIPIAIFSAGFLMDPKGEGDPAMIKIFFTTIPTLLHGLWLRSKMMKKYGVRCDSPMEICSDQGEYAIVTTSQRLQPGGFEHFGDNVHFAGYSKEVKEYVKVPRDTIFISLGTLCKSERFWNTCLAATKDMGYKVVLVLGGNSQDSIDKTLLHKDVIVHQKVSLQEYEAYIQRAVLFINHGGLNSITMSIFYETPVLVCPDSMEQHENGLAIQRNLCGKTFRNQKISVKEMKEMIETIVNNSSIHSSLKECSDDLKHSIGFEKVVDDMIQTFHLK